MILPALANASDRSWANWGYDVSKSVASAAVIALLIAIIGKGVGWGLLVRVRWSVLVVALGAPIASIAFNLATESYSTLNVVLITLVAGGVVFVAAWFVRRIWAGRREWLAPPPRAESYWDAYWAVRRGNPPL